jgi:transcriptional regulator with XRE-family HTH domain
MPRTKTLPELIRKAGFTHRTLGEKTGLHYTYFSKMARGQRSPSLARSRVIARALKVSLDELQRACAKGIA